MGEMQIAETNTSMAALSAEVKEVAAQRAHAVPASSESMRAVAGAAWEEELDALCTEVMGRVGGKNQEEDGEEATDASNEEIAALVAAERAFRRLQVACTRAAHDIASTACEGDGAETEEIGKVEQLQQ